MSNKEIMSAIERTIEETGAYQRENPEDHATIMQMNEHRESLEANLNYYDLTHPSPLRAIATSVVAPIGFVLSPVIIVGGLVYLGGRAIYEKIRDYYNK